MCGAGISVAAGIPDFRSPGTGIYAKFKEEGIEDPESLFTIQYFKDNPEHFYQLKNKFFLNEFKPTLTHLLQDKNLLLMCFTQNVDGLELDAGVSQNKLVQVHGSYDSAHCIQCNKEYSKEQIIKHIQQMVILRCDNCNGLVKPDLVFFGELLPQKFKDNASKFKKCDLLFVIGTSLQVYPFANYIKKVSSNSPKVLINKEMLSDFSRYYSKLDLIGSCDETIAQLCEKVGWGEDLQKLIKGEAK